MDDANQRSRRPDASRNMRNDSRPRSDAASGGSGGLLSRYGGGRPQDDGGDGGTRQAPPPQSFAPPPQAPSPPPPSGGGAGWRKYDHEAGRWSEAPASNGHDSSHEGGASQRAPYATPLKDRLSRRPSDDDPSTDGKRGAWRAFTGQARRLGSGMKRFTEGIRTPRAGEWRATDFDQDILEEWDRNDSAPFELPPDPDDESGEYRASSRSARRDERRGPGRNDARRDARLAPTSSRGGFGGGRDARGGGPGGWDDNWEDAGWETGTWDTGWATDYQLSASYEAGNGDSGFWLPSRGAGYDDEDDDDVISQSLSTLAHLSAVGAPYGRVERARMLLRRRPAAAAMLAFFLLGFMLTCCAPIVPILRLGYDAADAARRVQNLQDILAGGTSSLFNATKLKQAQEEVDGITHDLYEINGAMNIAGAPLAAVSPTMRNYRLLTRIGFDLTAAADEGLQVAQTLLTPLQGGALAADTGTPGLTMKDIAQARAVLADASGRVQDAIGAFQALDPNALPSQLKPGSKYYRYLQLLPTGQAALFELNALLDSAPALLGIGEPASYLVVAMDRTELRPIGGFMGNYGFLTLEGGKQSKSSPLTLYDTYDIDKNYYDTFVPDKSDPRVCINQGPQPPEYFWWFPYGRGDPACTIAWGLRDSGLSPDFPTNARNAMQIVEDTPNAVPNNGKIPGKLQGMIAFTPVLIEMLLDPKVLGPITMKQYDNITVTADSLEHDIHLYQLGGKAKPDTTRKTFTHELATALLARIKALHGSQLKPVLAVAEKAIKDKELQIYFNDPHAELILRQLGLASTINTGTGDGFFVVDTNDSGNKSNPYVYETQTDYVTLLPNGGALHHLRISVTYDKKNRNIFNPVGPGETPFDDYNDIQRTYLPADATILGYAGFNRPAFPSDGSGATCAPWSSAAITDCGEDKSHILSDPVTTSDVPGRSMIMGALYIRCGTGTSFYMMSLAQEHTDCISDSQPHTQIIYIEWYTPHTFTRDANGHGTYTMTVEKQPGAVDRLTVYIDNQINAKNVNTSTPQIADEDTWGQLIGNKKPIINNQLIEANTVVSFNF